MVAPVVPAAIIAGGALAGQLFGNVAAKKREERQLKAQALEKQANIQQGLGQQQQAVLSDLMSQYGRALIR